MSTTLLEAAAELARSRIVSVRKGELVCSYCQMHSLGPEQTIDHAPSCLVGRVVRAVTAASEPEPPANEHEAEFFRVEGRREGGCDVSPPPQVNGQAEVIAD